MDTKPAYLKLCCRIPKNIAVAVSGGIDSMAALDFLRKRRPVTVLHFNHATKYAPIAENFVREYCDLYNLPIKVGYYPSNTIGNEESWRNARYEFFIKEFSEGKFDKIVTCHHLNDAIEWWIFTSLRGLGKLIPRERDIFLRPFLISTKEKLREWCLQRDVPWIEDPSNELTDYNRNYIRHNMMSHCFRVNPGLEKTILKKYLREEDIIKCEEIYNFEAAE